MTTPVSTTLVPTTVVPPDNIVLITDTYIDAGPIEVLLSTHGEQFNICFEIDPIGVAAAVGGSVVVGIVIDAGPIEIELSVECDGAVLEEISTHWVKWSKIGYLDFTIDESNLAGEMPMPWQGLVYDIKKLGSSVLVYGQNGVSALRPAGVNQGLVSIYDLGVKNKGAVAGDELNHFFIDSIDQLWALGTNYRRTAMSKAEGLTRLGYQEFLSLMPCPVMSYDPEKMLLYICDGTYGFIYSVSSGSFGEGPINITGIDSLGGELYVVSDGEIDTPKFEICTDIYDFGTRKFKTIHSIEVGSDLTEHLKASVDYRVSYSDDFRQIGWFLVNPSGKAFPKCYGVEFRFRLRSFIYEYFEIDYLKIKGHIHGFSYLDTTSEKAGVAR